MLEKLSNIEKEVLLHLYNRVQVGGLIPSSWKESINIPIRKPGKDSKSPGNYRPIAEMGKTLERMVNDRLVYWLEYKQLVQNYQSGFRKGRSTMDPTVALKGYLKQYLTLRRP